MSLGHPFGPGVRIHRFKATMRRGPRDYRLLRTIGFGIGVVAAGAMGGGIMLAAFHFGGLGGGVMMSFFLVLIARRL